MIIQLKDNINYLQLNPRNWFIRYRNVEYMYINKSNIKIIRTRMAIMMQIFVIQSSLDMIRNYIFHPFDCRFKIS